VPYFRVAVDVNVMDDPGEGTAEFVVKADSPEAAARRLADLFGSSRLRAVERVSGWAAGRPGRAERMDLLQAIRDFREAGLSITQGLTRLLPALPPGRRRRVAALLAALHEGVGLGEALRLAGFPEDEAYLVEVGEETGRLIGTTDAQGRYRRGMIEVALELQRLRERLARALRQAAVYPGVILTVAFGLGWLFRLVVFRSLGRLMTDLGYGVPAYAAVMPTVLIGLPVLVAAVGLAAALWAPVRQAVLAFPPVGRLARLVDMVRVLDALTVAYEVGESGDRAFDRAARACTTEVLRTACLRVRAWYRGETPGAGREVIRVTQEAGFPPDFAFVYGSAVEAGTVVEALSRLRERYAARTEEYVRYLEQAAEYGLLLVVAGFVGVTVVLFYKTIYDIITSVT